MKGNLRDLEPFEREWLAEAAGPVDALRRLRSACPPLAVLRAATAAALPDELQAAVTVHAAGCAACRALQSDLGELPPPAPASPDEVRRVLERVRRDAVRDGARERLRWRWWRPELAAAALMIAAAAGAWRLSTPAEPGSASPPAAPASPQARGPQASADRPLAQTVPPRGPALEKPAIRMSLAVLTWRGAGDDAQRYLADIAPALDAFREDRYAEAGALLETLAPKYPDAAEVPFYLGVSRLFTGDAAGATKALESAAPLADRSFDADVSWYLGIAFARAGRGADARAQFAALCRGASEYRARACAAVRELDTSGPSS